MIMTNLTAIASLQDANKIIHESLMLSIKDTGSAFNNPVWDKLHRIHVYIANQVKGLIPAE
jgi:hypothetical protein